MSVVTNGVGREVVSREEWVEARVALLAREKALTRERDALARERQRLPWVRVEKGYEFETSGGRKTLGELFGGRSQLVVYHFMFGPGWEEGCPSCSLVADHLDGAAVHLAARDVSLVMVSRAALGKIQAFKGRMGWRVPWVSSFGGEFNYDFGVSFGVGQRREGGKVEYNYAVQEFPSEEGPGMSVFYRDGGTGEIFHTYSTYGRGLEALIGTYTMLDLVPKGRDEGGLGFPMAWVRYHDRYEGGGFADRDRPYWPKVELGVKAEGASCGCGCESKGKGGKS